MLPATRRLPRMLAHPRSPNENSTNRNLALGACLTSVRIQELGLRDYARIDGFVQLPPKPPQKREKPAELANYRVPTVEEAAGKLRPSDNIAAGLAPPWDPPSEEEDPLEVYRPLLEDGGWENMGPYTDPEVAKNYHSNDVELRLVQKTGGLSFVPLISYVQHSRLSRHRHFADNISMQHFLPVTS